MFVKGIAQRSCLLVVALPLRPEALDVIEDREDFGIRQSIAKGWHVGLIAGGDRTEPVPCNREKLPVRVMLSMPGLVVGRRPQPPVLVSSHPVWLSLQLDAVTGGTVLAVELLRFLRLRAT